MFSKKGERTHQHMCLLHLGKDCRATWKWSLRSNPCSQGSRYHLKVLTLLCPLALLDILFGGSARKDYLCGHRPLAICKHRSAIRNRSGAPWAGGYIQKYHYFSAE